jgi:hypothetical protein
MVKEVVPQIVVRRLKVRHRRLAAVLEGLRRFGFRGPATGGTPALCGCGPASSRGSSDPFLSDVLVELLCCRDQLKILDLVPFTPLVTLDTTIQPERFWQIQFLQFAQLGALDQEFMLTVIFARSHG